MISPTLVADFLKRLHTGEIRRRPTENDLVGEFEGWFDGGAFRSETGAAIYTFADGAQARIGVHPWLSILITFADGAEVSVIERSRQAATQTCAGCGGVLNPAETHQVIDGQAFHMHCTPSAPP